MLAFFAALDLVCIFKILDFSAVAISGIDGLRKDVASTDNNLVSISLISWHSHQPSM